MVTVRGFDTTHIPENPMSIYIIIFFIHWLSPKKKKKKKKKNFKVKLFSKMR
jgi:hypothetical protein